MHNVVHSVAYRLRKLKESIRYIAQALLINDDSEALLLINLLGFLLEHVFLLWRAAGGTPWLCGKQFLLL